MIPENSGLLQGQWQTAEQPGKTYCRVERAAGNAGLVGYTDGLEAVRQAILLLLQTERYAHLIYSWNYGVELQDLMGKPLPYIQAEAARRIEEALLRDDRILAVDGFTFRQNKGVLLAAFTAHTKYGDVAAGKEVQTNG